MKIQYKDSINKPTSILKIQKNRTPYILLLKSVFFSKETMETETINDIFEVSAKRNCQPKILYLINLDSEIKTILDLKRNNWNLSLTILGEFLVRIVITNKCKKNASCNDQNVK